VSSGLKRRWTCSLPFPEDEWSTVILSKAFLLADDDKIRDRTIWIRSRDGLMTS